MLLTFACSVIYSPALPAQETENVIINPGFEDDLVDWLTAHDFNMSHVVPEAARSGAFGLRVTDEMPKEGSGLQSLPVPVEGGNTYELSFWMRLVSGEGRVTVWLRLFDERTKSVSKSRIDLKVEPVSEWKRYSVKSKLPEEAVQAAVRITSANKDVLTVDIDDFELREVED
ncbi:MAG: carbohydrate binding domain-containing protein [Chthoniobacterales bacterium]